MRLPKNKQNLISLAMLALLLTLVLPSGAAADQRDRGRGRDHDNSDRKCEKFVNCHDARDGRWDGKGPRRNRNSRFVHRNRFDDRFERRNNRMTRRSEIREVNRTNTARFRRSRG